MRKFLVLITALLLPINSFGAECQSPVKLLDEGALAPCKGYLFSVDKELEVRIKVKDYELLKKEVSNLNDIIDRLEKKNDESDKILQLEIDRTELWKLKAEDITIKYVTIQENQSKHDFALILLGVGLTVLAGWSLHQAAGR